MARIVPRVGGRRGVSGTLMSLFLAAICAGSLAAAVALAGGGCGGGEQASVGVTSGKLAPPFSGVTLEGVTLTSEDFRGKPLFLVYATSG